MAYQWSSSCSENIENEVGGHRLRPTKIQKSVLDGLTISEREGEVEGLQCGYTSQVTYDDHCSLLRCKMHSSLVILDRVLLECVIHGRVQILR